jgi:hypothetical protein
VNVELVMGWYGIEKNRTVIDRVGAKQLTKNVIGNRVLFSLEHSAMYH